MIGRRLGAGVMVCALLAFAPAHAPAGDQTAEQQREEILNDVEWIGANMGAGWAGDFNCIKADVFFFTIRWPSLYWTILEVYPMYGYGFLGGGGRFGGRFMVGLNGREELRVGVGLGYANFQTYRSFKYAKSRSECIFGPMCDFGLVVIPHFQYIYNTNEGNIGVGLDLMAGFRDYFALGPMVYFRWSVH